MAGARLPRSVPPGKRSVLPRLAPSRLDGKRRTHRGGGLGFRPRTPCQNPSWALISGRPTAPWPRWRGDVHSSSRTAPEVVSRPPSSGSPPPAPAWWASPPSVSPRSIRTAWPSATKRFLGRRFSPGLAAEAMRLVPYRLVPGPQGDTRVDLGGGPRAPRHPPHPALRRRPLRAEGRRRGVLPAAGAQGGHHRSRQLRRCPAPGDPGGRADRRPLRPAPGQRAHRRGRGLRTGQGLPGPGPGLRSRRRDLRRLHPRAARRGLRGRGHRRRRRPWAARTSISGSCSGCWPRSIPPCASAVAVDRALPAPAEGRRRGRQAPALAGRGDLPRGGGPGRSRLRRRPPHRALHRPDPRVLRDPLRAALPPLPRGLRGPDAPRLAGAAPRSTRC